MQTIVKINGNSISNCSYRTIAAIPFNGAVASVENYFTSFDAAKKHFIQLCKDVGLDVDGSDMTKECIWAKEEKDGNVIMFEKNIPFAIRLTEQKSKPQLTLFQ